MGGIARILHLISVLARSAPRCLNLTNCQHLTVTCLWLVKKALHVSLWITCSPILLISDLQLDLFSQTSFIQILLEAWVTVRLAYAYALHLACDSILITDRRLLLDLVLLFDTLRSRVGHQGVSMIPANYISMAALMTKCSHFLSISLLKAVCRFFSLLLRLT